MITQCWCKDSNEFKSQDITRNRKIFWFFSAYLVSSTKGSPCPMNIAWFPSPLKHCYIARETMTANISFSQLLASWRPGFSNCPRIRPWNPSIVQYETSENIFSFNFKLISWLQIIGVRSSAAAAEGDQNGTSTWWNFLINNFHGRFNNKFS